MIIDIHGHYYSKNLYPNWVPCELDPLLKWADYPNIEAIAVSSLDVFKHGIGGNLKLLHICENNIKLWQWISIDPRINYWWENIPPAKKVLGLKLHPTWQNYHLDRYLHLVLEIAKIKNWGVLTHSGVKEPYVNIEKSIKIADKYPEVPIVFAHLGQGFSNYNDVLNQIDYLSSTKNSNTLIDTSSLAIHLSGLLEESIRKIGSRRILFGTDLPLHLPQSQLAPIIHGNIEDKDRENILYENALSYFSNLKGEN